MTGLGGPDDALASIRREIDGIDEGLLALLERRFAVTERVRALKPVNGSPMRPAREAEILRKLLGQPGSNLTSDLVLRVWRAIVSQSTLNQAPVAIHVSRRLNASIGLRLRIRDHFGTTPVEECRDEAQALLQVNAAPADLCIVETASPWVEAFADGNAGTAQVIGVLPFLRDDPEPKLLVFGHARAEATGDDETLIVSDGQLPRDFAPRPLWQVKVGQRRLSCLPGFLSEHESPLVSLARSNALLNLKVAGRYPSPMAGRP
jgi:chorismate mutase / prephenate dehydratase